MLLDPKTVAVFLDASPSGKKRAAHAAVLAHRWGAHLIGVHVVFAGATWPPSMDYVREQVASQGFSVAAAMLGYAEQSASDLLVIGAYSHARAREFLIGGTTRTLLAQTPMPTFISR